LLSITYNNPCYYFLARSVYINNILNEQRCGLSSFDTFIQKFFLLEYFLLKPIC